MLNFTTQYGVLDAKLNYVLGVREGLMTAITMAIEEARIDLKKFSEVLQLSIEYYPALHIVDELPSLLKAQTQDGLDKLEHLILEIKSSNVLLADFLQKLMLLNMGRRK